SRTIRPGPGPHSRYSTGRSRLAFEYRRCQLRSSIFGITCVVSLLAAWPASAAKSGHKKAAAPEPAAAEPAADEAAAPQAPLTETQKQFRSIEWTQGPAKVKIGGQGEIQVPEGFAYTGSTGAQKLLELMKNPTSGTELGILTDKDLALFLLFEFDESGYVKDA